VIWLFRTSQNLQDCENDDYTWCTGSTMVDINNDGWLDIYVGYSGLFPEDQRRNKLWINQGDNTFKDQAAKYGLDDPGYAVNANFFDFDKDGDLDMYLVNQGPEKNPYFDKTVSRDIPNEFCGDKLFRNDGDTFVDVTLQAGIYSSLIGFGHGAAVGDVDKMAGKTSTFAMILSNMTTCISTATMAPSAKC
jgi:hypothetical protein